MNPALSRLTVFSSRIVDATTRTGRRASGLSTVPARLICLAGVLALAGCVTAPSGPNVMALPGDSKSFEQFQSDEYQCKGYARQQVGYDPTANAANRASMTAAGATALGAVAGALIGGAGGRAGEGAIAGAGVGLLAGGSMASDGAGRDMRSIQHGYNVAYTQCMYAKGNKVPVSGYQQGRGNYQNQGSPGYSSVPPDYRPGYSSVPPDYPR